MLLSSNGEVSSAGVPDLSSRVIAELPYQVMLRYKGYGAPARPPGGIKIWESHFDYAKRYPIDFAAFKPNADCDDNIEGKSRRNLTRNDLLELWQKQDGRCAISGLPMTCRTKSGEKFRYNASIDRIMPGDPYERNNVQLVCTIINSLMKDFSKEDFIRLCTAHAD